MTGCLLVPTYGSITVCDIQGNLKDGGITGILSLDRILSGTINLAYNDAKSYTDWVVRVRPPAPRLSTESGSEYEPSRPSVRILGSEDTDGCDRQGEITLLKFPKGCRLLFP